MVDTGTAAAIGYSSESGIPFRCEPRTGYPGFGRHRAHRSERTERPAGDPPTHGPHDAAGGPRSRVLREHVGMNLADHRNPVPAASDQREPRFVIRHLRGDDADRPRPVERVKRPQAIQAAANRPAHGHDAEVFALPAVHGGIAVQYDDRDGRPWRPLVELPCVIQLTLRRLGFRRETEQVGVAADLNNVKSPIILHSVAAS